MRREGAASGQVFPAPYCLVFPRQERAVHPAAFPVGALRSDNTARLEVPPTGPV